MAKVIYYILGSIAAIAMIVLAIKECLPGPTLPPEGDLTGYVVEKFTKEPIDKAEVTVRPFVGIGVTKVDYSRSEGEFLFKSLPVGDYDLAVKKDRYKPYPFTSVVTVVTGQPTLEWVYLVPEEVLKEATLSPGPPLELPEWAEISTGLDIKVTSLASPQVVRLDFAGIMQEMVFFKLFIENVGEETVYLDFREAYLAVAPPIPQPVFPELKYDLVSSLFAPDGLQSPILKLEPYQEPIIGTVAFIPREGTNLPPELETVVPTFWAFREAAPLELLPVSPRGYTPPWLPGTFE